MMVKQEIVQTGRAQELRCQGYDALKRTSYEFTKHAQPLPNGGFLLCNLEACSYSIQGCGFSPTFALESSEGSVDWRETLILSPKPKLFFLLCREGGPAVHLLSVSSYGDRCKSGEARLRTWHLSCSRCGVALLPSGA
uniref:Putative FERT-1 protein n=2 Tax=Ascaris suum TaxID=6253 RepID=FER1_ASCSU|nr:RecName: Full=Putative FERT-1 protein [Ascaris suum]AAA20581.1 ORF1, longest putative CDS found in the sequence [Ascaris suum]